MSARKDALLVEYQIIQRFRQDYGMIGHRWGFYFVPLCGAIIWGFWNFGEEYLPVGIFMVIILIGFWRYLHHTFDDHIKKWYLRLVEIEEELDMMFTRRYLTREMQKSKIFNQNFKKGQLVTSDCIRKYQDKRIFGSRGLRRWDIAFGIAISILCLWLFQIILERYWIPLLLFRIFIGFLVVIVPTCFYGVYCYWKDKQD